MRRILSISLLFGLFFAATAQAQLSTEQRVADFQEIAAVVSKHYAFVEWKREAVRFNALDLAPWLERIRKAKDDLDFWEICAQYVASFQDSHSAFLLPSDYFATLGFSTDLYEGKVLIDQIDPDTFPEKDPPIRVGDEIISIDGKAVQDLINGIAAQLGDGNPRGRQRIAAALLTNHQQSYVPRAHEIGEKASLLIHRDDGSTATVELPWAVFGSPYKQAGPVPNPLNSSAALESSASLPAASPSEVGAAAANGSRVRPRWPSYMNTARQRQQFRRAMGTGGRKFLAGYAELHPVFNLPDSFVQRLGRGRFDDFFTGTFDAGDLKIGYLRVPSFEFFSTTAVQKEITYFEANTAGLVVDVMRNPGGYGCAAEDLAQLLHPQGFHSLAIALRVSWYDILNLRQNLQDAEDFGGTEAEIAELRTILTSFEEAFAKSRGLTNPLPLCSASQDIPPFTNSNGTLVAYSKPILVLTDDFTASAGDLFAAMLQDSGRAKLYGTRTAGAGGAVTSFNAGQYGETGISLAIGILVRKDQLVTMEYPASNYIENIGVRPDVTDDYQTVDNLVNLGKKFVEGFTAKLVEMIKAPK